MSLRSNARTQAGPPPWRVALDRRANGQTARSFPYDRYAEVMVRYSVGGVRPGELCVVSLSHSDVPAELLRAYGALLERGYCVGVNVVPRKLHSLLESERFRRLRAGTEAPLVAAYDHRLVLSEPMGPHEKAALARLIKRSPAPGETVQLALRVVDHDRLSEEILQRIGTSGGQPFLNGRNDQLDRVLLASARSPAQASFISPDERLLWRVDKRFQVLKEPPSRRAKAASKPPAPEIRAALQVRRKEMMAVAMERMARIEMGPRPEGKYFRTLGLTPSLGNAEGAGMTLEDRCVEHVDISTRSGPGSGLHVEALADGLEQSMRIYDEGAFTDEFLTFATKEPDGVMGTIDIAGLHG